MYEYIRDHQMNIMLALCAICAMMAVMLLITRFLSKKRKWILILMEIIATALLGFDRAAYLYRGDVSHLGYVMVRLSNFMVFFLTSAVVFGFNLYLSDLLMKEGKRETLSKRLKFVYIGSAIGMLMAVVAHFTGLYYSFDENNIYQRGPGFLLCYIVPVVFPIIQFTVIFQYRKLFSKFIYISLVLYIFVPIVVGIIQIFTYGLSIVNMAMVMVSVSLYVFNYLDINDEVVRVHEIEVGNLQKEQRSTKRLFDQTATAFVRAVEKRDPYLEGHAVRVAELARQIAGEARKAEDEKDEVYYAALLHDIGMIGIPDSLIGKSDDLTEEEIEILKRKPIVSEEILSNIKEYPYLREGALYSREHYDGSGYPEGLKGKDIPEVARIIAVADAYATMTSRQRNRAPLPYQNVREEFIRESGQQFDPVFADIMIRIMDAEHAEKKDEVQVETELSCGRYREKVSVGIPVTKEITKISFRAEEIGGDGSGFSAPSIILFDSYDRHVHDNPKAIEAYRYVEYAEIWFDGHYVSTNARNMEVEVVPREENAEHGDSAYEMVLGRFEGQMSVKMIGPSCIVDVVLALPDNSKSSYLGLTGENCRLREIKLQKTGDLVQSSDIRKIVQKLNFTDRLESDLPNIQVDRPQSAATEGIPVAGKLQLDFHTMSLPWSNLVWHCPHILLFYAKDKKMGGEDYREYALIKLNGEIAGDERYAENRFSMKKNESFPGWDVWKRKNKEGYECSVQVRRRGNRVVLSTENLGIAIENITVLKEGEDTVYVALTGDQVALTDIRIESADPK